MVSIMHLEGTKGIFHNLKMEGINVSITLQNK